MPARLPLVLGAGIASALLFVSVLGIFVAPAPLVAAGLRLGLSGALMAAMTGVAGVALVSLNAVFIGAYVVAAVPLALIVLSLILRPAPGVTNPDPARPEHWIDAGAVLASLALVPAVALLVATVAAGGAPTDLAMRMTGGTLMDQGVANVTAVFGPEFGAEFADVVAQSGGEQFLAGAALASIAVFWLVQAIVAAMLGMSLAQYLGPVVRPRPAYRDLRLPGWFGAVFIATLGVSLLGGDPGLIAETMVIVLCVPFFLLGFKLVHLAARETPAPAALLVVFYMVFLGSGVGPMAMVFVGLVEFATDLLRRADGRSMEDE